jgi:hypothetical protein
MSVGYKTWLIPQLQNLSYTNEWNTSHYRSLKSIDKNFTEILLQAETKSSVPTNDHWNSDLHHKNSVYNYWKFYICGHKSNRNVFSQLHQITSQVPADHIQQGCPTLSAPKQQHARKALIDAPNTSYSQRQVFLVI